MNSSRMFYCRRCKRVYFLAPDAFYLCNEERNFGLPSHEPWAIPEFVDYDASARTFACLFSACDSPAQHHPSRGHAYELMTRNEVILKFKDAVLVEVPS